MADGHPASRLGRGVHGVVVRHRERCTSRDETIGEALGLGACPFIHLALRAVTFSPHVGDG